MARQSRWDRPPAPRDLRWFVRLFGKTLIAIGLLMFGFVAYQLWGTGIEYARAQDDARDDFAELLELAGRAPTTEPTVSPTTTAAPTTTTPPSTTAATATDASVAPTSSSTSTTTSTVAPTSTSTQPAVDIASLGITEGDALVWLRIPRIGLDDIVVAGVGREELKKGPGHYPQTPLPGQLGNSAIAGHRTTFGGPFLHIDELEPGDEILVGTPWGDFVYRMTSSEIVGPDAWDVIATTDPTVATLTLTSCHPVGTASERIIVHAELDPTRSDVPGPPVFNYGRGGDGGSTGTLPGDDPAAVAAGTSPSTTSSPTTTTSTAPETGESAAGTSPTSTTVTTTPAPSTLPGDPLYSVLPGGGTIGGADGGGDGEAAEDAFGNHWFSDSEAWPHVAMWGAAATAIVVGAYLLARRLRNSWIGAAAGVLPFLVTLYFFYQNVNRLLPAAL